MLNKAITAGLLAVFVVLGGGEIAEAIPFSTYSGTTTTAADGKKTNAAFESWAADEGLPVREMTFDEQVISGSVRLDNYTGSGDVGRVKTLDDGTPIGDFIGFDKGTGGDPGLIPLIDAQTHFVVRDADLLPLHGVRDPFDLNKVNINSLYLETPPIPSDLIVTFGEGLCLSCESIKNFANTTGFGFYASTDSQIGLEVYDSNGVLLHSLSAAPSTNDLYFLGLLTQPRDFAIASARILVYGNAAIDGIVYTSAKDAPPPSLPVPESSASLMLIVWLSAMVFWKRRMLRRGE
ncbi:MAG: hypothetical protein ACE5FZ_09210 [Nitrospiria bacterium]